MPRIYVASLSDYNNGYLHGTWIEVGDGVTPEEVQEEVNAMLRESKYPNVMAEDPDTGEMVPSAEEWAIHDYELEGVSISEWEGFETVCMVADAVEEHGEAMALWIEESGEDVETAIATFEGAYAGEYESEEDYTYQFVEDTGILDNCPESLQSYFDYEAYTRDIFMENMASSRLSNGNIAVFYRSY